MSKKLLLAAVSAAALYTSPAFAAVDADVDALRAELKAMRSAYESKIAQLEQKVEILEAKQDQTAEKVAAPALAAAGGAIPARRKPQINDNSFNPEIGVVLNGKYQSFSESESEIAGFAVGEEAERGEEGLSIDETELNFSANVDDLFRGSATIALHEHDGDTEVEIEEAYAETTSLPYGLQAKAGRFFSELGYLNSHHVHADDFADRPLPNRVFLDNNYGDDGIQLSAVLPTDVYSEVGGGVFRGADFPAGANEGSDIGSWTAYGRVGGDLGNNADWRLGLSTLQAGDIDREGNEGDVTFSGKSGLYIADGRMTYAPTGNSAEQELILQGEYFMRDDNGTYEDAGLGTGEVDYDDHQSGWYAQSVYKFAPKWRIGARYSQLYSGGVPLGLEGSALDDEGHDPWAAALMVDWTNSEFSRVRAQFNREELADGQEDGQILFQYIMSLGAHGAHSY